MNRPKICFSLLNYRRDTHRHYYHIYEFIEVLGGKTDLRLLVMDAQDEPDFRSPSAVWDLSGHGFWARLRRNLAILKARRDGYRVFYHHYTTAAARFSAVCTRLLGGQTYLWHCIVMDALDRAVGGSALDKWLLKLTFQIVDCLVTGTPSMADYYSGRYGIRRNKIRVIPNYINLDRFNPGKISRDAARAELNLPPEKKIVLYLHELEQGRAGHLAPIVLEMLSIRSDTFFLIAGDGNYRETLENQLAEPVRANRVRFAGSIPNIRTPVYYAASDIYIMTSDFEAFSRVLLESMAMGIPYVATDGDGAIRSYTPPEHQPFILPRDQLDRFPEKICLLLDQSDLAAQFVDAGLKHVRQYGLDAVLDLFLKEILSERDL